MIHIIDGNIEAPPLLSLKQLQYAHFVAFKNEDGMYHILKDRYAGKTGLNVSRDLLMEYIKNVLK